MEVNARRIVEITESGCIWVVLDGNDEGRKDPSDCLFSSKP